jgi:ribose transport system substrate-binding protein
MLSNPANRRCGLSSTLSPYPTPSEAFALRYHAPTFLALTVLAISLGMATGCRPSQSGKDAANTPGGETAGGGGKRLQIAMIPKGTTHIFWRSVHYGALQAAKELDVDVQWRGPQKESDRDEQLNVIQGFVNKRVDGICLAPLDADAMVRPVREAGRGGVPVVIFDSGLNADPDAYASYVATDNFRGGQLAGEVMAEKLGGKGNVVMLRYNQGSESTYQREEGFLEAIKAFPDIKVISSDQYAGTTTESAMDKAQQILNRYGDQINGIFAVCEPNAEGVLRALEDRKIAGKVVFVGFDSSDAMAKSLREGKLSAIVLQDPVQMGYLAIRAMVSAIRGEPVDSFIDTGVYVATQENIDTPEIQKLLNPEKT